MGNGAPGGNRRQTGIGRHRIAVCQNFQCLNLKVLPVGVADLQRQGHRLILYRMARVTGKTGDGQLPGAILHPDRGRQGRIPVRLGHFQKIISRCRRQREGQRPAAFRQILGFQGGSTVCDDLHGTDGIIRGVRQGDGKFQRFSHIRQFQL